MTTYALSHPRITGVSWDFATHFRDAESSDNHCVLTWSDDNHQYCHWGDGWGFEGNISTETKVSLGFSRILGDRGNRTFRDTWGTPTAEGTSNFDGKTSALISIDGVLYSLWNPGSEVTSLDYSRLYKSTNHGSVWSQVSPNVDWLKADGIMKPCFLQFGKDYANARDTYVYTYWTVIKDGTQWVEQIPGEIKLSRVPKASIETEGSWEWYTGLNGSGDPTWSSTIGSAVPCFTDSDGVMRNTACYNPWLRRYLLVTNHTEKNLGNIAIWEALEPWGPWKSVYKTTGWPGSVSGVPNNTFMAGFAPKWWFNGGRSFVWVFTGKDENDSYNQVEGHFTVSA